MSVVTIYAPGATVEVFDKLTVPLWQAGMETGDMNEWLAPNIPGSRGGQVQLVNAATAVASLEHARSSTHSAKLTIDNIATTSAKVLLIRWKEPGLGIPELFYSAWYFVPQVYTKKLTSPFGFFNWWEFVSGTATRGPDPFFSLDLENVNGGMRFQVYWNASGNVNVSGPLATDSGVKQVWSTPTNIPIGRWFNVEARYKSVSDFTGAIQFWQDGAEIFHLENCRTRYPSSTINTWQVNNYGLAITPSPVVLYVDDAVISTTRIAAMGQ